VENDGKNDRMMENRWKNDGENHGRWWKDLPKKHRWSSRSQVKICFFGGFNVLQNKVF
jgi:hypothetical protein